MKKTACTVAFDSGETTCSTSSLAGFSNGITVTIERIIGMIINTANW